MYECRNSKLFVIEVISMMLEDKHVFVSVKSMPRFAEIRIYKLQTSDPRSNGLKILNTDVYKVFIIDTIVKAMP